MLEWINLSGVGVETGPEHFRVLSRLWKCPSPPNLIMTRLFEMHKKKFFKLCNYSSGTVFRFYNLCVCRLKWLCHTSYTTLWSYYFIVNAAVVTVSLLRKTCLGSVAPLCVCFDCLIFCERFDSRRLDPCERKEIQSINYQEKCHFIDSFGCKSIKTRLSKFWDSDMNLFFLLFVSGPRRMLQWSHAEFPNHFQCVPSLVIFDLFCICCVTASLNAALFSLGFDFFWCQLYFPWW